MARFTGRFETNERMHSRIYSVKQLSSFLLLIAATVSLFAETYERKIDWQSKDRSQSRIKFTEKKTERLCISPAISQKPHNRYGRKAGDLYPAGNGYA